MPQISPLSWLVLPFFFFFFFFFFWYFFLVKFFFIYPFDEFSKLDVGDKVFLVLLDFWRW
uniref:ATP synthase F0 subunit 8 n=1 Tax=Nemertopsis sp. WYS-2013 TaxID=1432317 RepID=A0A0A7AE61_9BILA|nr:ATP synthase F0 subunit 8 [Nemertopsis sp. WYS-2013]